MSLANGGSKCELMPRACSASNRWIAISLACRRAHMVSGVGAGRNVNAATSAGDDFNTSIRLARVSRYQATSSASSGILPASPGEVRPVPDQVGQFVDVEPVRFRKRHVRRRPEVDHPEVAHEVTHVPVGTGCDPRAQLALFGGGGEQVALGGHETDVVRYVHVMSPSFQAMHVADPAICTVQTLLHHAVKSRGAFVVSPRRPTRCWGCWRSGRGPAMNSHSRQHGACALPGPNPSGCCTPSRRSSSSMGSPPRSRNRWAKRNRTVYTITDEGRTALTGMDGDLAAASGAGS